MLPDFKGVSGAKSTRAFGHHTPPPPVAVLHEFGPNDFGGRPRDFGGRNTQGTFSRLQLTHGSSPSSLSHRTRFCRQPVGIPKLVAGVLIV